MPDVVEAPVEDALYKGEDQIRALVQEALLNGEDDEKDLLGTTSQIERDQLLKAAFAKDETVPITVHLGQDAADRFLQRFWHITNAYLKAAQELKWNEEWPDSRIFCFTAWALVSRLDHGSVERQMLPAIDDAAKECFGKEKVTLDDLKRLPKPNVEDENTRAVYICIAYGPDGEVCIYIGSTCRLVIRIADHDRRIRSGSKDLELYRILSQPGWKHEWRVLARFAQDTHQVYSYFLETVFITLASLDNSSSHTFHSYATHKWIAEIWPKSIYAFNVRGLNRALPTRQGFPLKDGRAKKCQKCHATSSVKQWYWTPEGDIFAADGYQCFNCYTYRQRNGRDRDPELQKALETHQATKDKRNVSGYRRSPQICDWCGYDKSMRKSKNKDKAIMILDDDLGICLCGACRSRHRGTNGLMPRERRPVEHTHTNCQLCDEAASDLTFVPYPVARFVCHTCIKASPIIDQLLQAQKKGTGSVTDPESYLSLVEGICDNSAPILRELRGKPLANTGEILEPKYDHDIIRQARKWRGLRPRGGKPPYCDYCGCIEGSRGTAGKKHMVNPYTRLVLCTKCGHAVRDDDPDHRLSQFDNSSGALNPSKKCGVCEQTHDDAIWTFVPYPIKIFACMPCFDQMAPVLQELVGSQLQTRTNNPTLPSYLELVERIRENPDCVPAKLRDHKLLPAPVPPEDDSKTEAVKAGTKQTARSEASGSSTKKRRVASSQG